MIKTETRREIQRGSIYVSDCDCPAVHPMRVARGDEAVLLVHALAGLMVEEGNALRLYLRESPERAGRIEHVISLIEVDTVRLIHDGYCRGAHKSRGRGST